MPGFWVQTALVVFLVFLFPFWDRAETRRLERDPTPRNRIRSYRVTMLWLWAATALLLATTPWSAIAHPPAAPQLRIATGTRAGFVAAVVFGLVVGSVLPFLLARANPALRERLRKPLEAIDFFLPGTRAERLYFAGVSITAGICEEIIFRGVLIRYFDNLFGHPAIGWAIAASALVFGLDHGYQGWRGMLGTTLLALLFTALFYAAGALWPVMLVHALFDLRILLMLAD